ncbi:sensor domain-containing protein [Salinarchaeum laminariae]|uniref:sensor domain-containing protein n=1 Tax=Salinarchaeum laminariae TaxID=869888 RepID=UPI0020C0B4EC|nr:sensor domain-containing protein [Salinarchaeum laminariae]
MAAVTSRMISTLRWFFGVAIQGRTYRRLLFLALAFPLGIVYFVVLLMMYTLGIALAIVLVGIPILVVAIGATVGFLALERVLAKRLLDVEFDRSMQPELDSAHEVIHSLVVTRRTLLGFVYLPSKFFVGIGAFVLLWCTVGVSMALLLTPLYYGGASVGIHLPETMHLSADLVVGWGTREIELVVPITIGSWMANSLLDALGISVIGLVMLVISLHLTNLAGWILGLYSNVMLR